jgi:hypothetical protein
MNLDKAIETATRDHQALFAVDPQNKPELERAYGVLKSSLEALNKDVAERAFQDGRSKRKQWVEIQKQFTDLLEEGRHLIEGEGDKYRAASGKIDNRYSRIHLRITKLADS